MLCVLALAFCATAPIGAAKLPNPKLDRIVIAQMSPHMGGALDGGADGLHASRFAAQSPLAPASHRRRLRARRLVMV